MELHGRDNAMELLITLPLDGSPIRAATFREDLNLKNHDIVSRLVQRLKARGYDVELSVSPGRGNPYQVRLNSGFKRARMDGEHYWDSVYGRSVA